MDDFLYLRVVWCQLPVHHFAVDGAHFSNAYFFLVANRPITFQLVFPCGLVHLKLAYVLELWFFAALGG